MAKGDAKPSPTGAREMRRARSVSSGMRTGADTRGLFLIDFEGILLQN